MTLKIASGLMALTLLGGCIIIDADDDGFRADFSTDRYEYGTVYGADVSGNSVAFIVSSNGCTDRSFFDFDILDDDGDVFEIGVRRVRQDHCKALVPEGVEIGWTYSEMGLPDDAEVIVRNRVRR
jgi:hypothetical protein